MKKVIIALTLVLSMIFTLIPLSAQNEADFVLEGDSYNIKGQDILDIEGSIVVGENRPEANRIYASDCIGDDSNALQMLHRIFKGDVITFTVDFGSDGYEGFGFYSFGAARNTVFELYIDNSLIGECIARGGNGWADNSPDVWFYSELYLGQKFTGIHEVKLVVIDSAVSFPANAFGKFVFTKTYQNAGSNSAFVLDTDEFNISGRDLIEKANIYNNPDKIGPSIAFDGNVPAENPGQMLFNVGAGDSIKFTADFGDKGYSTMAFYDYGLAPTTIFEVYVDDVLVGEGEAVGGNGWADNDTAVWNYSEIEFDSVITGIHDVEIRVVESNAEWPFNVFGNFLFYYAPEATSVPTEAPATEAPTETPTAAPTENPTQAPTEAPAEEKSCGSSSAIAQVMLILGAALILKKRK